jgi:hypothetical protein
MRIPVSRPSCRHALRGVPLAALLLAAGPAAAMSFGEYSAACADNGGSAYVDGSGIYQCGFSSGGDSGGGGGGSSGGGRSAAPAAPNATNQMMLNLMQAASPYVQQAIHDALYGNPQEAAARAAEAERRRQEKEARDEAVKRRLLGEPGGDGMSMMGLQSQAASLQMMTGDQALRPLVDDKPPSGSPPQTHSDAYSRGHDDAARCISSNAGPYCSAAADTSTCVGDYGQGYQVGAAERKQKLVEAFQAGQSAGQQGGLANGAADPRAGGECRSEWVEAYNAGYQITHAPLAAPVPKKRP